MYTKKKLERNVSLVGYIQMPSASLLQNNLVKYVFLMASYKSRLSVSAENKTSRVEMQR